METLACILTFFMNRWFIPTLAGTPNLIKEIHMMEFADCAYQADSLEPASRILAWHARFYFWFLISVCSVEWRSGVEIIHVMDIHKNSYGNPSFFSGFIKYCEVSRLLASDKQPWVCLPVPCTTQKRKSKLLFIEAWSSKSDNRPKYYCV
jgi:hypothetical protein